MADIKTLRTDTLNQWLQSGKEISILDIRPVKERAEWFIPHSLYFNAYDSLKAKAEDPFKGLHLEKNILVVVVCASGKTSLAGAEILQNQGYEAYSLEGGMKHWTLAWNVAEISFDQFKIIQLRRTGKGCLSYIVASNSEAVIVDASLPTEVYEQVLTQSNLTLKFVTETHIHADHLSRARLLAEKYNVPLLLPIPNKVEFQFEPLKPGYEYSIGSIQIKPIATPGHTLEA